MISRYLAGAGLARTAIAATVLLANTAWAEGPGYTYAQINFEYTDVKFGVNPGDSDNPNFRDGDFEGVNLDLSLGILSWLHIAGQYFDGECVNCSRTTDSNGVSTLIDMDFEGFKVGLGFNINLNKEKTTDLVIRGNFIDVELDRADVPPAIPPVLSSTLDGDGYSVEVMIRSQISEKADVMIGYEYQNISPDSLPGIKNPSDLKNRDLLVGIGYRVTKGLSLRGDAIVFDDNSGFSIGIRYNFDSLWGRDSIFR